MIFFFILSFFFPLMILLIGLACCDLKSSSLSTCGKPYKPEEENQDRQSSLKNQTCFLQSLTLLQIILRFMNTRVVILQSSKQGLRFRFRSLQLSVSAVRQFWFRIF